MPFSANAYALLGADDRPVCDYDGIIEVATAETSQVLSEPLENGELAVFNKVQAPDMVKVSLSLGYDPARQSASLGRLRALKRGVGRESLCKLVSPSDAIEDLALEEIGQSHTTSQGATLLTVELTLHKINSVHVTVTKVQWSPKMTKVQWSPKNATAAQPVNNGRVQPQKAKFQSTLSKAL